MAARRAPREEPLPELAPIRPADTGDIYDIYMLNCQSFIEAWSLMALGMWQERGDDLDVLYTADGVLAAYYLGQNVLDEVHIMQLAVAPQFRRLSLGQRLMQHEIQRKRAAGMKQMLLEVRESNRAARRLYASLGFEEVGRRSGYYAPVDHHPPEDALLMDFRL